LIALVRDSGGTVVEITLDDDVEVELDENMSDFTTRH
jgi:hypothetical protein